MKAAYRLDPEQGMARLKQQARWLESEYRSAAAGLLEGLAESFTVNRLGLPADLAAPPGAHQHGGEPHCGCAPGHAAGD